MVKGSLLAIGLALILIAPAAWGQALPAPQTTVNAPGVGALRSSDASSTASMAEAFRLIAEEIARTDSLTPTQADQAIIFLTGAKTLDPQAPTESLQLKLATQHATGDYSQHVRIWLKDYVGATCDRVVVAQAVRYLLSRLVSQAQRQQLLESLVSEIGNRNSAVDADLAYLLGRSMVEKGDLKAAKFYLIQSYANNKYNAAAFASVAQLVPDEVGPSAYLEHLRLGLRENPLDLNAALGFAQYAEQLQLYDVAAGTYAYAADLHGYLYPNEPLPSRIYLPWAVSSYNSTGMVATCLRIAERVRNSGQFDFFLEALAGRAAAKQGDAQEALRLLNQAEQRALQLQLPGTDATANPGPRQMAWFYCFAKPEPEKALDWANQAYAQDANSPATAALLAYASSMNDRLEWAKLLVNAFEGNQILDLVRAQIQLSEADRLGAIESLKVAIARDPSSLAAERAREMLRQAGGQYTPETDPQILLAELRQRLGPMLAPRFQRPDQMVRLQLDVSAADLAFGDEIDAAVTIANTGVEPLVLTDTSFIRGRIRIDARVNGDLSASLPELVSETLRSTLVIPPGRSVTKSVRLSTGELRRILMDHPQADLGIDFVLYLDPVSGSDGAVRNRLADIVPATASVPRPGLELTAGYIRNRLDALDLGREDQTRRTALLVTGLLSEQRIMAERGTLYPYRNADWLRPALREALVSPSGLLQAQGGHSVAVRVETMAEMLSNTIDKDIAAAVATNLQDRQWPVRLMAAYLLARSYNGGFDRVLEWLARNDASNLVRGMAVTLRPAPAAAPNATRPLP